MLSGLPLAITEELDAGAVDEQVQGAKCLLVSSDAFSAEKLSHMQALGAELKILRSDNKKITAELVTALIETSRQFSQQPRHFWADQFNNPEVLTG